MMFVSDRVAGRWIVEDMGKRYICKPLDGLCTCGKCTRDKPCRHVAFFTRSWKRVKILRHSRK